MTKNNEWLNDYEEFLNGSSQPSGEVKNKVFSKIKVLLNPSPFLVFSKMLGIHFVVGFLSLSICHQFGLNPFNTQRSLADWFMSVGGHGTCMVLCGVLFVSLSVFAAGAFLTIEEVRALKKNELLQNLSLGVASIGFLVMFGAEITIGFGGLWLVGALIGGVGSTEVLWKIRRFAN